MTRRFLALAFTLTAAIGCGGGSKDTPAPASKPAPAGTGAQSQANKQIADGAKQVAEGAKQVAQGVTNLVQAAAKPVDSGALKDLLPDVDGWKKVGPEGEMISSPVPYALAHCHYTKDASTIDLEIKDSALSQVLLGPATMFMTTGFEHKTDDEYRKAVTFEGSPGYETWNRPAATGDLTVVIAGRFLVTARGRGVASTEPVKAVVKAVNLQKLAKLK